MKKIKNPPPKKKNNNKTKQKTNEGTITQDLAR